MTNECVLSFLFIFQRKYKTIKVEVHCGQQTVRLGMLWNKAKTFLHNMQCCEQSWQNLT